MATKNRRPSTLQEPAIEAAPDRERAFTTHRHPGDDATIEEIRMRAYYLSLDRDGNPADPVGDWLRAEHELTVGANRTSAAHRTPRTRSARG